MELTVRDLIELLSKEDPDTLVAIPDTLPDRIRPLVNLPVRRDKVGQRDILILRW